MKKIKSVDVRKVLPIGKELIIDRVNANDLRDVYFIYLREKNIKLTYDGRSLLDVVDELEDSIYDSLPKWEDKARRIIKKDRNENIASAAITSLILLGIFGGLTNYGIHEAINVENSESILDDYAIDTDNDGIKEINTNSLESFDDYTEPTEFALYKYTNPIYQVIKNDRISDNISMKQAMDNKEVDIIKIDDQLYSSSGYVSFFTVKKDDNQYLLTVPYNFETKEEALEITEYKLAQFDESYTNLDYISTVEVKTLDEIPSIYKNKEDGKITTKKGIKALTKLLNFN